MLYVPLPNPMMNQELHHEFYFNGDDRDECVRSGSAEAEQAEMQRILEDMKQFREQGNWVAVEKKYQRILGFSKGTPTFEMHVLGAEAASNQGNVSQVKVRLTKALEVEEVEKQDNGWIRWTKHLLQ